MKTDHTWRTRPDPFADTWPEVRSHLEVNPGLEAKTLFEHHRCGGTSVRARSPEQTRPRLLQGSPVPDEASRSHSATQSWFGPSAVTRSYSSRRPSPISALTPPRPRVCGLLELHALHARCRRSVPHGLVRDSGRCCRRNSRSRLEMCPPSSLPSGEVSGLRRWSGRRNHRRSSNPDTRPSRQHRRRRPRRDTGDIKIPVDRGSDLASYQESVWAILPDTVSLEFGFAHGREFVVD